MNDITIPDFKIIDKTQTGKNVRNFLDKRLDKWLAMSGMQRKDMLSITTVKVDEQLKDDLSCAYIYASQVLIRTVTITLSKLPNETKKPYRTILEDVYISGKSDFDCAFDLGYSSSRYRELKSKALNLFAINFVRYQLENHIINPLELISYKNKDSLENKITA